MKIAFICLVIYAYIVNAFDQGDNEPIPQQAVHDGYHDRGSSQAYYGPAYRQRQPTYRPQPNRNSFDLWSPLNLYFLIMLCRSAQTTVASTTTTMAMATGTTDPLAECTQVGNDNCYYCLSETSETWNAADVACKAKISGGRLAVTGLNVDSTARKALIDAIPATGVTFWVGVEGVVTTGTTSSEAFIAPLDGISVTTAGTPGFTASGTGDIAAACGRLEATNTDAIVLEECDSARRYLCEVCP